MSNFHQGRRVKEIGFHLCGLQLNIIQGGAARWRTNIFSSYLRNQEIYVAFFLIFVTFPALDEANQWYQLFAGGVAPSPRYQHSAAWDSDGMYVFGGWGIAGPTNDVHFYDRQADVKRFEKRKRGNMSEPMKDL